MLQIQPLMTSEDAHAHAAEARKRSSVPPILSDAYETNKQKNLLYKLLVWSRTFRLEK